jgi:hypothetical protein
MNAITTTLAQQFADRMGNDGQRWHTDNAESFAEVAEQMGATVEYSARAPRDSEEEPQRYIAGHRSSHASDDPIRYAFSDGSAVVAAGAAWDIEGAEPFSWAGA